MEMWLRLVFALSMASVSSAIIPAIQTVNGSLFIRLPTSSVAYVQWVDEGGFESEPDALVTQTELSAMEDRIMQQVLALTQTVASQPVMQLQQNVQSLTSELESLKQNLSFVKMDLDSTNVVLEGKLTASPTCQCVNPADIGSINASLATVNTLVDASLTCSAQGLLLQSQSPNTCRFASKISCPTFVPNIGPGGNSTCLSTIEGTTCQATCVSGYYGSPSLYTCTKDGLWLPQAVPSNCLAICPTLAAPADGNIVLPSLLIAGQHATFTCNTGFTLIGNSSAVCRSDFQWSTSPRCAPVPCPAITPPSNGALNQTTGVTRDVLFYSCYQGYRLVGSNTTTCLISSTWAPAAPVCQAVACSSFLSNPGNGTVSGPSGVTGSIQFYQCNTGYTLVGSSDTTCLATGSWSSSQPTCAANPCPLLVEQQFGTVSNNFGTTGSVRTYSCNQGYTLAGTASTTCLTSGLWNSVAPVCNANACSPSLPSILNGTLSGTTGVTLTVQVYACNAGFTLVGTAVTTCQPTGTWSSPVAPICTANSCPTLVSPLNGRVSAVTGTTFQARNFSCNTGYVLSGASTLVCTTNGNWSFPTPTCPGKPCSPNLVNPGNGTASSLTGTSTTVTTYSCNPGFTLSAGPTNSTCQTTSLWTTTVVPTCRANSCPVLPLLGNGTVSNRNGTTFTVRTFACNTGFTLLGSTSTTCQTNGTWLPIAPTCDANDCFPLLVAPANGAVNGFTGEVGQPRTYSCNAGYTLVGTAIRTCTNTGAWSSVAPTCSAKSCPSLVAPGNGTVSATAGVTYTERTFACNAGYTLVGLNVTTCQTNSAWTVTTVTCNPKPCPTLVAPGNGTVSLTSGFTGHVRTYACNTGYTLTGSASTTCTSSSAWSTTAPTCVAKSCPTLIPPGNGTIDFNFGVTLDVRNYQCNTGFTLSGSATRTCLATSLWSPTVAPTCVANSCPTLSAPGNGTVSAANGTTFVVRTYGCNAGYILTGAFSTQCNATGSWTSVAPTCRPKPCPSLVAPTFGSVSGTTGVTGDTRVYSCSLGYSLTSAAATVCLTSSTWSGPTRTCAANSCLRLTAPTNGIVSSTTGTTQTVRFYSCNSGFTLVGAASTTCTIYGNWSVVAPTCV